MKSYMNSSALLPVGIACVGLFFANEALAQAQSEQIETVTVTARKTAENIQKIPVAVTAISPTDIKQASIRTAQDVKFLTPGLQANQNAYDDQNVEFKIRGIYNSVATLESPIGVYIDGVYQPMIFGLNSSLFDISQIEIDKGPQGTLYGKNSIGGVVNIETQKPELDILDGYASVDAGAYPAQGVHGYTASMLGEMNFPIVPGKISGRVDFDYDYSSGWGDDGLGKQFNTRNDVYGRAQFIYQARSNLQFILSGNISDLNSSGSPVIVARVLPNSVAATDLSFELGISQAQAVAIMSRDTTSGNFYDTQGTAFGPFVTHAAGASLTGVWDINEDLHLKSISAYSTLQRYSSEDYDGTPYPIVQPNTGSAFDFLSQEFDLNGKSFGDSLDWIGGLFASGYHITDGSNPNFYNIGNAILPVLLGDQASVDQHYEDVDSLGAFVHGNYHVTDALALSGGIRWSQDATNFQDADRTIQDPSGTVVACAAAAYGATLPNCYANIGSRTFTGISYDVAANYQFTDDIMAYATTRRGYKDGGWNFAGSIGSFAPEFATDYEIGLKSEWWDKRVLFNTDAYWTNYEDIQRTVAVVLPNGQEGNETINAASAVIKGVESELRVLPADGLELGATYTYTDPQYTKFEQEISPGVYQDLSKSAWEVARHVVTLHGMYTESLSSGDALTYRADWVWQSSMVLAQNSILPESETFYKQSPYGLVNARITYTLSNSNTEIALYAKNLLDKQYNTTAVSFESSLGYGVRFPGEPRFVGVELTKHFGDN